jgi:hypothetical protein
MAQMMFNLEGCIKNIKLTPTNCLSPLYEAIINSFHAIEERGNKKTGSVTIRLHRDYTEKPLPDLDMQPEVHYNPIVSFSIEDNGIGFTRENFDAFRMAYTPKKEKKGGKGVGRFLWLKAFQDVHIESTYHEGGVCLERDFMFSVKENVSSDKAEKVGEQDNNTVVHLQQYKEEFAGSCPKEAMDIVERIIYHFLSYFEFEFCPDFVLKDGENGEIVFNLKEHFEKNIKPGLERKEFKINDHLFQLLNVHQYGKGDDNRHRLIFCANGREVKRKPLSGEIIDLQKKLTHKDGNSFYYVGIVSGEYLDGYVDPERTDFNIPKKSEGMIGDLFVSEEDIIQKAVEIIKEYLDEYLQPISEKKVRDYKNLINSEFPEFRSMVNARPEILDAIKPGLSNEQFETDMHERLRNYRHESESDINELLNFSEISDYDKYERMCAEVVQKITDTDKDSLARLVIHRKSIIELLDKNLNLTSNGKYALEKVVHNLIFPQGRTSDDIPFKNQNLWLIDERFAFHLFLASDKKARQDGNVEVKSQGKPDIYIESLAFTEGDLEFPSIAIVEFKRPNKENYGKDENPIDQVKNYIEIIRPGKAKTHKGRIIPYTEGMRFYCYIICTLTPKIEQFASNDDFSRKFDNSGWFRYHGNYKAWIEIIDYNTLVRDARRRNRAFCRALNIKNC